MKKRLLLLYTSGTIGMDYTSRGLAPVPGLFPRQIRALFKEEGLFDIIEYPDLIDSSAVTLEHWNRLIDDVVRYYETYDGFIIVHGTDTMAYSASALAFALQGLTKPVVFTGAQLPLLNPRSDGWANLADAFDAANQADLHEVVIVFGRLMMRACRARKVDTDHFHGFDCPNDFPLGRFDTLHPLWQRHLWLAAEAPFRPVRFNQAAAVAVFFLTPGVSAKLIGAALCQPSLQAAVLMCYGQGNAPADAALLMGIQTLTAAGGLVLTITQSLHGAVEPETYAASQPLLQAGALPGNDLTPEAALAKLTWLVSLDEAPQRKRELVAQCLIGERSGV